MPSRAQADPPHPHLREPTVQPQPGHGRDHGEPGQGGLTSASAVWSPPHLRVSKSLPLGAELWEVSALTRPYPRASMS